MKHHPKELRHLAQIYKICLKAQKTLVITLLHNK